MKIWDLKNPENVMNVMKEKGAKEMYIIEQLFSHHGYEYLVAVISIFAFIVIYNMIREKKKY
ncbi:hypothetical protein TISLANDTSLP1_10030 [Thermodesulfovibrio yellowstonii]|uniref:Uncharacterized protein n=1 Tax=Thermodesulfovibrio yellowstonii TaxID=28262 RepID=A0A9W6GG20_9BACT|nr:hypothetical protein TISLANDTSLP1_10030 [Thermodesulfovibrio islandicus]